MIWVKYILPLLLWTCCNCQNVCEEPPEFDFGEMVSEERAAYSKGDRVQYRCNPGYTLEGPEWITCKGPKWTFLPKCLAPCRITRQQMEANNLLLPGGRRRSRVIQNNQTLQFLCREGYVLSAPSLTKCIDGHMDLPSCIFEATCPPPTEIAHGEVTGQLKERYMPNDTMRYQCDHGWRLFGPAVVKCLNKQWTKPPRCTKIVAEGNCGRPPSIQNGDVLNPLQKKYTPGTTLQYKCQSLYVMNGTSQVRCENGHWTEAPTCIEPCTVTEEDMELNNIQLKWRSDSKLYTQSGDIMEFTCKRNYRNDPSSPPFRAPCIEGKVEYPRCIPT